MKRRTTGNLWSRSLQRTIKAMTRTAVRAGTQAVTKALRAAPRLPKAIAKKPTPTAPALRAGVTLGATGARRYHLHQPPGVGRNERLPLLVMLHGCSQDAKTLAAISQMNRLADRQRFLVLYPEQDRLSNPQGCWNWFDTRTGRAQAEAAAIMAAIDQVSLKQAVDPTRIAIAGFSAGAGMAALVGALQPARFSAVVMHSGIGPGVAHSSVTAMSAMRGRRSAVVALAPLAAGTHLPGLLVIHGSADHIVAHGNGFDAARLWAARVQAKAGQPRTVQRGKRHAAILTDYRVGGQVVATLCAVQGLGHGWSGGAAGQPYSDPAGPDASRMIWAFAQKQFARVAAVV
ncbi:MAG: PHB depolymerase family esterase [Gammaproteobacteria bacterium]|uniref:extracellular catalytic domain type 1 short-chain-length polyhydroxyalkanoate depolymerase n=1 Tax=Rhodoferax sp. TaxID=50421 RepID=UPI001844B9E1|nr:PHB depolymerase family esterase [Rhodoferax sp.]MBU3899069.1 PHB depolymerase family esterase [Gammaproteobacteria bacterium]MBA3057631.1 prolyl oligopeptidase family serine peptidase [Rhodoferax sp.]MBU3997629.1 PHB depolymerase family esterase [Gammaproteobacteria bacterium]MBU4018513.1 PHB depolymerase family esterase [Gammaproteobacteria bacterium]MBU4080525.1 PHB depolymerase family esterase [Gammaproteobacteria bacterium]